MESCAFVRVSPAPAPLLFLPSIPIVLQSCAPHVCRIMLNPGWMLGVLLLFSLYFSYSNFFLCFTYSFFFLYGLGSPKFWSHFIFVHFFLFEFFSYFVQVGQQMLVEAFQRMCEVFFLCVCVKCFISFLLWLHVKTRDHLTCKYSQLSSKG